ncbi:MAG: hypothetical protein QOC77_2031 [Thermoleophilaceae bacterium]|nr:hypothetical protein [Thermoleophilaceae bacterium]MEA2469441.1 hypothetical protein [Thermoleophilaceae bacterium]
MTRFAALALAAIALLALAVEPAFGAAKPKPKLGHTVLVRATDGHPTVKPPHKKRIKLKRGKTIAIPVGSTVDTTSGHVKLTSAKKYGGTQSGEFSQGAFVVTQGKSDDLTDLTLAGGNFAVCQAAHAAGVPLTAAANRRRRLFGNAHGHFRTRGRSSSATVRGTQWLTEDRCNGTVTQNKSPNTTSKVSTDEGKLHFDLDPGQTITYYCNKLRIEPDTYCVMLLAYPDQGIVAGGILTQYDVTTYRFCVAAPDGQIGCTDPLPLTGDDEHSFRQGVFACPVRQVGTFTFGWSLDGTTLLFPTLALTLNVVGPDEHCQTIPTTEQPIAKGLPKL